MKKIADVICHDKAYFKVITKSLENHKDIEFYWAGGKVIDN